MMSGGTDGDEVADSPDDRAMMFGALSERGYCRETLSNSASAMPTTWSML